MPAIGSKAIRLCDATHIQTELAALTTALDATCPAITGLATKQAKPEATVTVVNTTDLHHLDDFALDLVLRDLQRLQAQHFPGTAA